MRSSTIRRTLTGFCLRNNIYVLTDTIKNTRSGKSTNKTNYCIGGRVNYVQFMYECLTILQWIDLLSHAFLENLCRTRVWYAIARP